MASDLGKQYSANAILERCNATTNGQSKSNAQATEKTVGGREDQKMNIPSGNNPSGSLDTSLTDALLQPEYTGDTMPFDLKKKKKRKKRKNLSNNQ